MKTQSILVLFALFAGACSASPPPDACNAASTCAATRPDAAKATAHLKQHVQYPATRSTILAACAQTKEFSDAEKQWFNDNLPDGNYASADDAIRALKL